MDMIRVMNLASARTNAVKKRTEATALRQSAWSAFESALFTSTEEPGA